MAKEPKAGKVHIVEAGDVLPMAASGETPAVAEPTPEPAKPEPAPGTFGGVIPPKGPITRLFKSDDEMIDVMVPRAFLYTSDTHVVLSISAGPQKLPKRLAEHPWFKANKVTPLNL